MNLIECKQSRATFSTGLVRAALVGPGKSNPNWLGRFRRNREEPFAFLRNPPLAERLFKDHWVWVPQPKVMPGCVPLESFRRFLRRKRLVRLAV